jgi:hypothetical protein
MARPSGKAISTGWTTSAAATHLSAAPESKPAGWRPA